jgi:beta-glucosidase/6-phospho-beta-glucosidase/beta-galactosidase
MIDMHASSYHIIKEYHPDTPVGVAFNWAYMRPYREGNLWDQFGVWFNNRGANEVFFDALEQGRYTFPIGLGDKFEPMKGALDFIGLNYYCCHFCKGFEARDSRPGHPTTDRGRAIWPEGMYLALKKLGDRFDLPIIITENGVATTDEDFRIKHMTAHLAEMHKAMAEGVPVKGYMHWSITDNWEWTWGFKMRFGLIHIDYETQERTVKKSGHWYADLIRSKQLEVPEDLSF